MRASAPGVPSMTDHPGLRGSPWLPRFERWVDAMSAGQPIVGDVETSLPLIGVPPATPRLRKKRVMSGAS
jgi:hypothetical protein